VDLEWDDAAAAAREVVSAITAGGVGAARAAELADPPGHDATLWSTLAEAGLAGLGVGESREGGGVDLLTLAAAAEALGAALAPVPFVEHAVASRLLERVAPAYAGLPDLATGRAIATICPRVVAGRGIAVPAGAVADVVVAPADGELMCVRDAPGTPVANQGGFPIADRDLSGDRMTLEAADGAFDAALAEWHLLMAAWLAGLSRAALDLVTGWVKERHQFGVPIGSFQAVQHGLADLPGLVDGAVLLAAEAAWALDTGERAVTGASGRQLADMALIFAADTARRVTGRTVQYHGGLGVALEHDAQLFYRRAHAYPLLAGAPRHLLRGLGAGLVGQAV
jgi:alkylation response protein AidB-like acyl-CoA dehydrogenase